MDNIKLCFVGKAAIYELCHRILWLACSPGI